jgi:hypothetical protein
MRKVYLFDILILTNIKMVMPQLLSTQFDPNSLSLVFTNRSYQTKRQSATSIL